MAVGSNPPSYVPTDYSNNYDIEDRPKHGPGEFNPLNGAGGVGYDPSGKKVFWAADGGTSGQCEIYFFSITGQRLAQFGCKFGIGDSGSIEWSVWMAKRRTHVGGQLTTDTDYDSLGSNPTARDITTDRLGSIRARGTERYTYYPYGEVRTSTGTSSLYAALESPVRGYDSNAGRFDRPDPLGLGAVKMGDPGSWNRFAYVQGDPVNYADPGGKFALSTAELEQWATKLVDRNGSNAFGIQYALTQWRIASLETAAMQEAMFRDTMMGAMNGAAIDAAQEARNFMVGRFTSGAFSQECQGKLDALGVNAEQMAASLSGASFSTTMGNLDSFADLYKDSTQYGNAKAQYKNLTIDHFFDDNPNVSAVSSLGGNRIYLNPSVVNNYGSAYMAALLSHEVLHNMGMDDDTIKKKLGIPAGGDTRSITLSMFSCVPGQ
jgi:RHS repeat-associated protein